MLFSGIPFLYYFLPVVLIAYYLAPKGAKNRVLLLASLVFYGWGEPKYVFLMLASIGLGYGFGLLIEKFQNTSWAKVFLAVSIVLSLGLLGYFKYANFFIQNFNSVTDLQLPLLKVMLPIGISFYTFQMISYLVDVYRGKVAAQKNLISLATYITMFPQLIAGPIVRYSDVQEQLKERNITFEKIAYGIRRFVLGLGKKILLANVLGEFCAVFQATDEISVVFCWCYAIAVSLQIYFDFSGYSDMAIGLGSMLGFSFPENFNYPFISKSATEFWRRWHMTLGTWFRDYVYIPLGGSRCSFKKTICNLFVVWLLTGLWHGAEWNFVIWGLYFAILLILEKSFLLKWLEKYSMIGHCYLLLTVSISFVIFDSAGLSEAFSHIGIMFGNGAIPCMTTVTKYYVSSYIPVLLIAVVCATPLPKRIVKKITNNTRGKMLIDTLEPLIMIGILILATAYLVDGAFNPFLYFRF